MIAVVCRWPGSALTSPLNREPRADKVEIAEDRPETRQCGEQGETSRVLRLLEGHCIGDLAEGTRRSFARPLSPSR